MSKKYKFHDAGAVYFTTLTAVDWIDLFTRDVYRQIIIDSLAHCQQHKGLIIHAWVIMTNHVHLIISSDGKKPLDGIMRDMKSFTSKKIHEELESTQTESRQSWMWFRFSRAGVRNPNNLYFQFWQQGSHPILLRDADMIKRALFYVHNNPVVAGFVAEPQHWIWSSALDYAAISGKLPLMLLDV